MDQFQLYGISAVVPIKSPMMPIKLVSTFILTTVYNGVISDVNSKGITEQLNMLLHDCGR